MAQPDRPSPSLETLSDLGRSEGLRPARWLPAGLKALALGEALAWLEGSDRQRAAAWLIRKAGKGEGLAGFAAATDRVGRVLFGGQGVPAGREALFQLTRHWQSIPDPLRGGALGCASAGRWVRAIERAAGLDDPRARASACEVAGLIGGRLGSLATRQRPLSFACDPRLCPLVRWAAIFGSCGSPPGRGRTGCSNGRRQIRTPGRTSHAWPT